MADIREEVQDEAVQMATQFFQQEFFSAIVDQCFDACRRKHLGTSLSETDQVCMRRCADKFLASFAITSQVFYSRYIEHLAMNERNAHQSLLCDHFAFH